MPRGAQILHTLGIDFTRVEDLERGVSERDTEILHLELLDLEPIFSFFVQHLQAGGSSEVEPPRASTGPVASSADCSGVYLPVKLSRDKHLKNNKTKTTLFSTETHSKLFTLLTPEHL